MSSPKRRGGGARGSAGFAPGGAVSDTRGSQIIACMIFMILHLVAPFMRVQVIQLSVFSFFRRDQAPFFPPPHPLSLSGDLRCGLRPQPP